MWNIKAEVDILTHVGAGIKLNAELRNARKSIGQNL